MNPWVRDVIEEAFSYFEREEEPVMLHSEAADDLVTRLDAAGFVIVPKRPPL